MSIGHDPFFDTSSGSPQWQLSDDGNGGTWKAGASYIQFDIANDLKCGGTATEKQTGTAILNFHVTEAQTIVLSMKGSAESSYEKFDCYIDDVLTAEVQATDSDICQVSTCNMCHVEMDEQELHLTAGDHTIRIEVDTIDAHYHSDAYFRINFSMKQSEDVCKSCDCP